MFVPAPVTPSRWNVTPATRRKVLHRDQFRCRVPGCTASHNLDVHHIIHREHGGTNGMENLAVFCESHHIAHHAGKLEITGTARNLKVVREADNAFANVQHAVETASALKNLGYQPAEIQRAVAAAKTHVGRRALSLQDWLTTALRSLAPTAAAPAAERAP